MNESVLFDCRMVELKSHEAMLIGCALMSMLCAVIVLFTQRGRRRVLFLIFVFVPSAFALEGLMGARRRLKNHQSALEAGQVEVVSGKVSDSVVVFKKPGNVIRGVTIAGTRFTVDLRGAPWCFHDEKNVLQPGAHVRIQHVDGCIVFLAVQGPSQPATL